MSSDKLPAIEVRLQNKLLDFFNSSVALPFGLACLFLLQGFIRFGSQLNIDSSWYLIVARRVLEGERLFQDILEVNPPLGVWLSIPPVLISDMTGLSSFDAFFAMLFALAALSLYLSWSVLRHCKNVSKIQRNSVILISALAFLFAPGMHFGQREHFMAMLYLPWVVVRFARLDDVSVSYSVAIASGVFAAFAIALKPHAIFAPLLVECFMLWRLRSVAPLFGLENVVALVSGLTILLLTYILTPEFFSAMLALGVVAYVPFYGRSLEWIVLVASWLIILLSVAWMSLRSVPHSQFRDLGILLFLTTIGFGLSYVLQFKGSQYHLVPAISFVLIVFGVTIVSSRAPLCFVGPAIAFAMLMLLPSVPSRSTNDFFAKVIEKQAPENRSFFFATTIIGPWLSYAVENNYRWASSMPGQWLAPYVSITMQANAPIEDPIVKLALKQVVDDMMREKPRVIFVDERDNQDFIPNGKFDHISFWHRDSRFEEFWKQYEYKERALWFAVYVRKP